MFIDLTAEQKRLRAELREYFENCLDEEQRAAILADPFGPAYMEHCKRLGRDGMLGVALPKEYGGRGYGPVEQTIFANEIARAEVTYPLITLNSVAPTILQYGTDAQKEFFIPRILAGECHFAIGYSEPGAGTDLAAFRIVQESLTNVTRHAGPGPVTARVHIAYGEHEIVVRVEDDGQGVSLLDDRPSGSGIRGMRERAAALGGAFDAGPRPGGGFRVHARLPLNGGPDGGSDAPGDSSPDTAAPGKGTR